LQQLCLGLNQRWVEGKSHYRPPEETIRTAEYDVAEILDDTTARDFVLTHHYSGTFPSARFRIGLYRRGGLVGVAVFSHPCSDKVLTNVFPVRATSSVELGRFVLLDEVPGNGETWFLARAFDILRSHGIVGVISFSDPMPRKAISGDQVFLGHVGTIYAAHNGVYLGRGTARALRLLPDARVFSDRAAQKIRKGERGWRYAAACLEKWGASTAPDDPEDRRAWFNLALQRFTTTIHHRGNHKYAWPLQKAMRRALPLSLPYPKFLDAAA
jgi:hypothetical protein